MRCAAKVLLVYDSPTWAWRKLSDAIVRYAPKDVAVSATSFANLAPDLLDVDAVLFWHWSMKSQVDVPSRARIVTVLHHDAVLYEYGDYPSDQRAVATTEFRNRSNCAKHIADADGVVCCNPSLLRFAKEVVGGRARLLRPGVDRGIFFAADVGERRQRRKIGLPLKVGWCGQCSAPEKPGQKGYKEILAPLLARLDGFGWFDVSVNARTANDSPLGHSAMANWYRGMDLFLCTSLVEGSPMPVVEAASCGVPVMSTNVGDVANVVPECARELLLKGSPSSSREIDGVVDDMFSSLTAFASIEDERADVLSGLFSRTVDEQYNAESQSPLWIDFLLRGAA